MHLPSKEKLLKHIEKEYIKRGRTKEDAQRIARAVVFYKLKHKFKKEFKKEMKKVKKK